MKIFKLLAVTALAGSILTGCGSSDVSPDLRQVLNRTISALSIFDKHLKDSSIAKVTEKELGDLSAFMQKAMNAEPRFYKDAIGVKLMKDASFEGYKDANVNGTQDSGEKRIFTVEIDSQNKRLIATDATGQSTGFRMGSFAAGLFAGALMGRLMGRQRAAGIKPSSFNNRKVTPVSQYARSRSRSGGLFGGK